MTNARDDRILVLWKQSLVERGTHVMTLDASSGRDIWRAVLSGPNEIGSSIHSMVPDGSGGALISWTVDQPSRFRPNDRALVAQRMDASGHRLWGEQGVILGEPEAQFESTITPDGAGGAYVASDVLTVHHVDVMGNESWAKAGIPLCSGAQITTDLASMPRGEGEAIMVWLHRGLTEQLVIQSLGLQGITSLERPH